MNAPPFPLNPTIGERFGNWVWNGSRWVSTRATGIQVLTQVWSVAGTYPYQPSPGLVSLVVEGVGGGAGGGGAQGMLTYPPPGEDGWMCSGGGGSGGGYSRKTLPAALVLGGVVVTVGAGGLGGPVQASTAGGDGGATSFGAFCVAAGGHGGLSNVAVGGVIDPNEGQGGSRNITGSIGDLVTYGSAGEHGQSIYYAAGVGQVIVWGGRGGASHFQSVEAGVRQSSAGTPGSFGAFGSGGGGGCNPYIGTTAVGGLGGDGVLLVTEYCWGDAGDVVCCDPNTVNVNARVAVSHGGDWDGDCGPYVDPRSPAGRSRGPSPYGDGE
jgi:hypothetical protein